jgi:gliding motility-associated-like protein
VKFFNNSKTNYFPDSISKYNWDFDEGEISNVINPQYVFKDYGSHIITLKAYSSICPNLYGDTSIRISIKYPRKDSIYPRINAIKNVQSQLFALNGGKIYSWKPLTGLTDSRIQSPFYKLNDSKVNYTITIIDSAGCIYKDQQEVWAFEKPDIFIASGFSPNNDGINDKFAPEYIHIKYLEYFKILDKNNRQIFLTNDMKSRWDGTFRGTPLAPDPFIVVVSGIDIYGKKISKQGIVVLVK